MMKITEKDLVKLATMAVVRTGKANVSQIRRECYRLLKISDLDKDFLLNRGDDQKWKQIVRNLVSHRTLEKYGYAYYNPATHQYVAAPLGYTMADKWLREIV